MKKIAGAAACLSLALVAVHWSWRPSDHELLGVVAAHERAQADQGLFSVVFSRAVRDKQALAVQRRLASKDIRLSQSLLHASFGQDSDAARESKRMEGDVRRRSVLEGSVHKLAAVLGAEEQELKIATARLDNDSRHEVALRRILPQLRRTEHSLKVKLARAARREVRARRGESQQRFQEREAKQAFRQAARAYKKDSVRAQSDDEKATLAMSKAGLERSKAEVAERKASLEGAEKGKNAAASARREKAKAALLKARARASVKSAQLLDAEAKEARSHMGLMKASLVAARQRVQRKASAQRQQAWYRQTQRRLDHEVREAELEQHKGGLAQARLLHGATKNKGIVSAGLKDVHRAREGLKIAIRDVEREDRAITMAQGVLAHDHQRAREDQAQAADLRFAAAQHEAAADALSVAEKGAAAEAKGLMNRAKDMLVWASQDKAAQEQQVQLEGLRRTLQLEHRGRHRESLVRP